jgi:hypothetical protein
LAQTGLSSKDQDVLNLRNYTSSVPRNPGLISQFTNPQTRSDAMIRMGANILAAPPGDKLGIRSIGAGIAGTEQQFDKQWDQTMNAAEKGRDLGEKMMEASRSQAIAKGELGIREQDLALRREILEQGGSLQQYQDTTTGQVLVGHRTKMGQLVGPDGNPVDPRGIRLLNPNYSPNLEQARIQNANPTIDPNTAAQRAGVSMAAPQAPPIPLRQDGKPNPAAMQDGQTYQTARGPAKWSAQTQTFVQ